jgi:heterodisulfide reductase subunit A-like polyferredoxin
VPAFNPMTTYAVPTADDGFIEQTSPNVSPTLTGRPGVFATGTAMGPMDIVESIVLAGAAASEAAAYLEDVRSGLRVNVHDGHIGREKVMTHA